MEKKLSEMTLEELWELFPIILTEHREEWARWYAEEAEVLRKRCSICTCGGLGITTR